MNALTVTSLEDWSGGAAVLRVEGAEDLGPIQVVLLDRPSTRGGYANEAIIQCGSRAWCAMWASHMPASTGFRHTAASELLAAFTNRRRTPRHEAMQLLRVLNAVQEALKQEE